MSRPGQPMLLNLVAKSKPQHRKLWTGGGHLSIRNTGTNTLWLSWDGEHYFDVACGTSFDEDCELTAIYFCTQVGQTTFTLNWMVWT